MATITLSDGSTMTGTFASYAEDQMTFTSVVSDDSQTVLAHPKNRFKGRIVGTTMTIPQSLISKVV
jgi:hypothetical protein